MYTLENTFGKVSIKEDSNYWLEQIVLGTQFRWAQAEKKIE